MAKREFRETIRFAIFIIVLVVFGILIWAYFGEILSDMEKMREFVIGFEILAPLVFIFFAVIQVLVFPVPGQIIGVGGGYLFGAFAGTLYSMLGVIIGSYIAFKLAQILGRPFIERIINKEKLKKFDNILVKKGNFALFLIYLLPALPDDALSFFAGLTKIKTKIFLIIVIIGRFPGIFVLNLVGSGFASGNFIIVFGLFIALMGVSLIIFIYKERIERLIMEIAGRIKNPNRSKLRGITSSLSNKSIGA